jgi:dTDP-4-dehydrorhamnose reductase
MSKRPRILILGAMGQVGVELQRSFAATGEIIALGHNAIDLSQPGQIPTFIRRLVPDVILNAAAYTAVDRAESEPELARAINSIAPGILAEEALRAGALLVHYSTDYVFDGSKKTPWIETDDPNPLNVYGATKLEGERAIQQVGGKFLIFRTSWVYGPHGQNFLFTMLRLGKEKDRLSVVDDQIGAPTTSCELADATREVVTQVLYRDCGEKAKWTGLYHMSCSGSVSWCGFARAIFELAVDVLDGRRPQVNPIATSEYPMPARRPGYSVLCNAKLEEGFGVRLQSWESALDRILQQLRLIGISNR